MISVFSTGGSTGARSQNGLATIVEWLPTGLRGKIIERSPRFGSRITRKTYLPLAGAIFCTPPQMCNRRCGNVLRSWVIWARNLARELGAPEDP